VESGSVERASSAGKIDMFGWKNGEFPPDGGAATRARPYDPAKSNWPGHECVTAIRHTLPLGPRAAIGLKVWFQGGKQRV